MNDYDIVLQVGDQFVRQLTPVAATQPLPYGDWLLVQFPDGSRWALELVGSIYEAHVWEHPRSPNHFAGAVVHSTECTAQLHCIPKRRYVIVVDGAVLHQTVCGWNIEAFTKPEAESLCKILNEAHNAVFTYKSKAGW